MASRFLHWALYDSIRHCAEGAARRGNLLNGLLRHFVPRNDGNSGNPQSLIKVTDLTSCASELRARLDVENDAVIVDVNRRPVKRERVRIHLFTSKRFAFTLAEVLITLAVIGVVAAMTIPNLVQSYKKKVVETKLVKFYSMMNNAIKLAEVDYGPQSTWTDYHINGESDDDRKTLYDKGNQYDVRIKKYFAPYIKITGSEEIRDVAAPLVPQKVYYLSDGSAFSFNLHENREIYFYPNNPKNVYKNLMQRVRADLHLCLYRVIIMVRHINII